MDDDVMMYAKKCCHLVSLAIRTDCQNEGYGSSLLRQWAKETDAKPSTFIYVLSTVIDKDGKQHLAKSIDILKKRTVPAQFFSTIFFNLMMTTTTST